MSVHIQRVKRSVNGKANLLSAAACALSRVRLRPQGQGQRERTARRPTGVVDDFHTAHSLTQAKALLCAAAGSRKPR